MCMCSPTRPDSSLPNTAYPPYLSHSSRSLELSYRSQNGSSTFSAQKLLQAVRSPWKTLFPEHSLAHFLIRMSLFKYFLSQRPSQALLAETMNHSILIYLFCSTYLKSYDLLFCLLTWLSPLLQCRFYKNGTFLISPGTGHIVGAQ